MANEVEKYVSLSELARLANVTGSRIVALHNASVITEDARSGNSILFRADRVAALVKTIKNYGITRSFNRRD
jgi:hypothetical protein